MFEMKNENDETATKKKTNTSLKSWIKTVMKAMWICNSVSLLEADNELYNTGIVDVLPISENVCSASTFLFQSLPCFVMQRSLQYKQESAFDAWPTYWYYAPFEEDLETFKKDLVLHHELASEEIPTAIDEIDKTIKSLEKTKAALLSSENNFYA